ncbi:MAG TPA: hypothetical protein VFO29_11335 [Candidatus Rubrimentiphilum sp.]|nr:hypothetical protein [Candidatus Rubrimentiphilum sp.]
MIRPDPPEPKYWKALVGCLILAIPTGYITHAAIPMSPLWFWLGLAILLAFLGAYSMHRKARYDASAQWQMNFSQIDRATYIPPNVQVRDK